MHTNLLSMNTLLSLGFFRGCYKYFRRNNLTPVLSENIPSLIHACLSTLTAGYALLYYNPQTYYFMGQVTAGYMISDLIHIFNKTSASLSIPLIGHHILTCIALSLPHNKVLPLSLFLAESSNIPNNFTYLLIKAKANPALIKKSKIIQFYSFLIGRVISIPIVIWVYKDIPEFGHLDYTVMKWSTVFLYSMSVFWSYKLYNGLNK